ncbi:hypothetical protein BH24ACI5_BH24ACI5_17970 [soil metagenome]
MYLAADGFAEFIPVAGHPVIAGLGRDLSSSTSGAIDYAFAFWPGATWEIREAGMYRSDGRFAAGDRFRVIVQGTTVLYQQNGMTVYQSAAPPTFPLVLDTVIFTLGGGLSGSWLGTLETTASLSPEPEPTPAPALSTGGVINVAAGGNLQAALDQAVPGDTIVLQAGARFVGYFRLPAKTGTVTLRSSGTLPDRRVTEADAPLMATIASGGTAAPIDLYDSSNWILDGIRFEANVGGYGETIAISRGENIVLRRLLLVVPSGQEQKRFVLGNGRHITLTQSYCSGVWRSGQDSQCFVAWDGAGPYTITDNFLEAASENVMFGGADSISPDNIPADILVEHNFFSKRLEWKGHPRNVKNLFELKAAKRVVVRHNVFERNWVDGQSGTAIVFTPRNQDGTAPWSVVEDVLFEYNIVRDTPSHFNVLGYDNLYPSQQTTRITIRHNLLLGSGGGRLALIGNEVGTLVFDHNTYVSPQVAEAAAATLYAEGTIKIATGGSRVPAFAVKDLTFTNNLAQYNTYGFHSSLGLGSAALTAMCQAYTWANNVLAGGLGVYPATTTFLPVGDYPSQFDASYYLVSTSQFTSMATDGTDLGWNRFESTGPTPTPTPTPTPEPTPTPTVTPTLTPEPEPEPTPEPAPISITTTTLADGVRRAAYAATLATADAQGTVTWRVSTGSLPSGLSLNTATGLISGKPDKAGTSTFTVTATDSKHSASRELSIRVRAK